MLRDIEELSTSETAAALDLTEHNIKVRLHLCRAMARGWLLARVGANAKRAFPFMGARCDRVVRAVFRAAGEAHHRAAIASVKICLPPRGNPALDVQILVTCHCDLRNFSRLR
jgi:hypothetical protein